MNRQKIYEILENASKHMEFELTKLVASKFSDDMLLCYLVMLYDKLMQISLLKSKLPFQMINNTCKCIDLTCYLINEKANSIKLIPSDISIINSRLGRADKFLTLIYKYWHYDIAFQAFKSQRYLCDLKNNTFVFYLPESEMGNFGLEALYVSEETPIYREKYVMEFLLNAFSKIGSGHSVDAGTSRRIMQETIDYLVVEFGNSLEFFKLFMDNGHYTVKEFLSVYSFLLLYFKGKHLNRFLIICNIECTKKECQEITGISESKINIILEDLTFNHYDNSLSRSIFRTPLFETKDGHYYASFMMLLRIDVETIIHKTWQLRYSKAYDASHKSIIEPSMCENIKRYFSTCSDFVVVAPRQHINIGSETVQFDVVIYDKVENSLMIIEAKDHQSAMGTLQVSKQATLENEILTKTGGALSQLQRQENIINNHGGVVLCEIFQSEEFMQIVPSKIYKVVCELCYPGTYKIFQGLALNNVAFMPYYILMKKQFGVFRLSRVYNFFYNGNFSEGIAYKISPKKFRLFKYNFEIPLSTNDESQSMMRKILKK